MEPNICPLCWAFQNPNTGECLVCGKHYHLLDVPITSFSEPCVGDFVVPLPNGFLTFKASVVMTITQEQTTTLYHNESLLLPPTNDVALTFNFLAETDEPHSVFQIYGGLPR